MEADSQGDLKPKPLRLKRKRKNPFGSSEDDVKESAQPRTPFQLPPVNLLPRFSDLAEQVLKNEKQEEGEGVEWRLVSRVRFTSPSPLPCRFRAFEEVTGTVAFTRCLHTQEDACSRLFQQSLVWQHPVLPWLNLYPRTQHTPGAPALSSCAQAALHSKWCDSLRSLYQLLRLFQCPFFYLCGPHFTALFRCAGAAAFPALHALLVPTSRSLRAQLTREGISFRLPLARRSSEGEEEGSTNHDSEGEEWLESLGLSQDAFPLRRNKIQSSSRGEEDEGSSLVCIEGAGEVQALVNFLVDAPCARDKSGALTGVPPTLLAPCAFLGATLQPLQMSVGRVREGTRELHSLELRGPLLPSALHALGPLLPKPTSLNTLKHTDQFTEVRPSNAVPAPPSAFAHNNLAECGLDKEFVKHVCTPKSGVDLNIEERSDVT